MKQRFSSLDIRAIVYELSQSLVSLRLANVYDLSSRIFLLKFAKPNHREQLIIDSGFRCHLTSFARATAAAPSPFVARLRKLLRTRRLTKVEQVGTDRVIEFQFSDGQYRLFLEFYAGGNIVLTDADLTILGLLRNVNEGAAHEQYRLGLKYDLTLRQNYDGVPPLTKQRVKDGLQKAIQRQQDEAQNPGKKVKKKSGDALRKALAVTTTEFPPILLDHALYTTGYDREAQPEDVVASEELLDKLLVGLQEAQKVVTDITSAETVKGYILAKRGKPSEQPAEGESDEQQAEANLLYDDFHPFKPAHLAVDPSIVFVEHDGFNKTVDEFFSSLEGQKLESRLQEREETARKRIEAAWQEQAKRLDGLQQVQELNVRKAQAIEANVERVEEAVAAVNGLIAQGMDWVDIGRLIQNEQSRRNAVAEMIKLPLKLEENTVTLLLSEYQEPEDEGFVDETDSEASDSDDDAQALDKTDKTQKPLTIDIDLALSPWANAKHYYGQRKSAAEKQEKTAQASQQALKNTEKKVMADLKKGLKQEKEILRPVRKQMWFEKFIYFISSDGYLVLAGRDAQQNEMLYRRYLRKGDVYVHADLHGAASVIIKNNSSTPEAPIPPSTLSQAGNLAVCTSSAWESKAVMSAWWVNSDQVSKTAPTGEYLTTGGFMIRGKKNFLPPAQLLLGFAVLFRISEESKARHLKHRLRDPESVPISTPELTEAETVPDSVADAGEDDDDDDEFPDADPGPAGLEEDDENPEPAVQTSADEDDDFPDAHVEEDEDHKRGYQSNPLQGSSLNKLNQEEEDDLDNGDDEKDEESDADDETRDAGEAAEAPVPAAAEPESETDKDNESSAPVQPSRATSAKERKEHRKAQAQAASKGKKGPQVRGKKGKAKKMAQKYADQDEEDRELAMKLLGSKAAEEKRQAEEAAKAAKTETAEEARARRRAQHEKAQKAGLEAEEIRRLNLEEGVEDLDEDEAAQLTQLDSLVGTPLPGDEILEAIPLCAPWSALTKYKYKAKMQPGQQKKGKAVREILGKWSKDASDVKKIDQHAQDSERIWPREAELLKGLKEAEVVGVIPVRMVRVMMSGGGGGAEKRKGGGGKGGKGGGRGGKGGKKR
jgi:predicted ribosome quality control (RQC) complex YloA/Tae2 family protein